MTKLKNVFLTATIILLLIGAWPLAIPTAIITLIVLIFKKKDSSPDTGSEIQELRAENQKLREELERAEAVRRAMDQAEKRD